MRDVFSAENEGFMEEAALVPRLAMENLEAKAAELRRLSPGQGNARSVGGIQIEDDLRRRRGMRRDEQINQQPFDHRRVVADLVIARGSARPSSSRLSVDLPASGAHDHRSPDLIENRVATLIGQRLFGIALG
jgi:hypothetical protein